MSIIETKNEKERTNQRGTLELNEHKNENRMSVDETEIGAESSNEEQEKNDEEEFEEGYEEEFEENYEDDDYYGEDAEEDYYEEDEEQYMDEEDINEDEESLSLSYEEYCEESESYSMLDSELSEDDFCEKEDYEEHKRKIERRIERRERMKNKMSESEDFDSTEEESDEIDTEIQSLYWAWEISKIKYQERRVREKKMKPFPLHMSDEQLIEMIPNIRSLEICQKLVTPTTAKELEARWKKAHQRSSFLSFWSEMNGAKGFF